VTTSVRVASKQFPGRGLPCCGAPNLLAAVMFDVGLRGFPCVVGGMVGVSVGGVGVVSSFLVASGLVMLRGFLMVSRRMLVIARQLSGDAQQLAST
jgi:hypothetical protein